jgi:hypothetical protein
MNQGLNSTERGMRLGAFVVAVLRAMACGTPVPAPLPDTTNPDLLSEYLPSIVGASL